jgi:hypothetical protein
VKDAENESNVPNYVEEVLMKTKDFMASPENMHDRSSVIGKGLVDAVDFTGCFVCLLGARNCGNSL